MTWTLAFSGHVDEEDDEKRAALRASLEKIAEKALKVLDEDGANAFGIHSAYLNWSHGEEQETVHLPLGTFAVDEGLEEPSDG